MGCSNSKEVDNPAVATNKTISPLSSSVKDNISTSEKRNSVTFDSSVHSGITKAVLANETQGSTTESNGEHERGLDESGGSNSVASFGSRHSGTDLTKLKKPSLAHSTSAVGLDSMIESRKQEGDLKSNVVHIEVPFGKPIEEVYDGVHTGPVLGSGISGLVRLVTHKATGVKYAVKCLDLGLVETAEGLQQLREEIFIMCQLDHPNIVRLEEVYESHSEIYLVQELCLGGELFDRLDEQPDYHYTEAQCARLVKQMLCSVRYLHSKGIIHRDLKLENFLFSSTSQDSELKMIDFGLSKHFKFGEVHHEAVGTPYTVAPEVIRGSYDERCDIWAIGVITFLLLSGDPPFGGCGGPEPLMTVRSNILRGSFSFAPEDIWSNVSCEAREFIKSLLKTNPQSRPTAKEAQKHNWLSYWSGRNRTDDDNRLSPNVVKALVSFKEFSDMRKLLCEVLSFTLLPDQIKELRKEFEKMDTDGSGEISLAALKQVLIENAGAGSLGSLTEEEVEDIFNAMRVRKSEQRIHWHEFIAAGISQCQVDDRNLRLAFDRLDSDHKGYITFENVMDLMGSDATQSEESMRQMWGDSMDAVNCHHARITYEDFLLLMKGQTKEAEEEGEPAGFAPLVPDSGLHVLHEVKSDEGGSHFTEPSMEADDDVIVLPSGDKVHVMPPIHLTEKQVATMESPHKGSSVHPKSAPVTPMYDRPTLRAIDDFDAPLSMDEDEDADFKISQNADGKTTLSPPHSPLRDPERITPPFLRPNIPSVPEGEDVTIPLLPEPNPMEEREFSGKRRSRSFDQQEKFSQIQEDFVQEPSFEKKANRAMMIPEHIHTDKNIDGVIQDETATPLVVNRVLYRAHRQMRLAVLEASKRFEEEQARRARDILMAQNEEEGETKAREMGRIGAGLVIRHGLTKQVSADQVRKFLRKDQDQRTKLIEKAKAREGRRSRKKTVSDMTAMMSGLDMSGSDFGGAMDTEAATAPKALLPPSMILPTEEAKKKMGENDLALDIDIDSIVQATVPGKFRKTRDPFSDGGRYGEYTKSTFVPLGASGSHGAEPQMRTFGTIENVFNGPLQQDGKQPTDRKSGPS